MSKSKNDDLEEKIRKIVADIIEVDPRNVTLDAHFVKDLGMDSVKALELLVAMEKQLKIRISDEDLPKIVNLREVVRLTGKISG